MKHEINAETITSPANANYVIVKQASIKTDTGFDMELKLIDDSLNKNPIGNALANRYDYGVWEATFCRNGETEELFKVLIGTTLLRNPNTLGDDPTYCGLDASEVEGPTAHDSLRWLLAYTVEKLLAPLPFSALGHYVVEEYVEAATWMLKNNLASVNKHEVRATCTQHTCKLERLWAVPKDGNPVLKQTLVSFNPLRTYRQTMLIEGSHHVKVQVAELPKITARYQAINGSDPSLMMQQQPQTTTTHIPPNNHVANIIQYLQVNGFDRKTIDALREEALTKPHLFHQGGYPQNHGGAFQQETYPPLAGFTQGGPIAGGQQF